MKEMLPGTIGKHLRILRLVYDVTEQDLAARLGLSPSHLVHYESGRRPMPAKRAVAYLAALASLRAE